MLRCNSVSLSTVLTVRLVQALGIGGSSPWRLWAAVCSQESVLQVREHAVPMRLSRVPGCPQSQVFTQHNLAISLHRSLPHPPPAPPPIPLPHLPAAPLTNGAVLPGDVSVICLKVFGGFPGIWKVLAEEKAFRFRLRGRGAGGTGAVLFRIPGCLWTVPILPFRRPTWGFQGEAGNCRGKRSLGGDLVIRGGTVPADVWIRSFFPCSKPMRNAHLRAPKSLCKRRARVACGLPPRPRLCRARHRCRQSTPGAPASVHQWATASPAWERVRRRSPAGWVQEAFGARRPGTRGESCGPRCSRLGVAVGGRGVAGAGRIVWGWGEGFWPGKLRPSMLSPSRRSLPLRSAPSPPLPGHACPSAAPTELEPVLL